MNRKQTPALFYIAAITLGLAYLFCNSSATAAEATGATNKNRTARTLESDQFWQESGAASPLGGQTAQLNTGWWEKTLRQAPLETPGAAQTQNGTPITLPGPDGGLQSFRVVNSPILETGIAARYPQLQTFAFRGVADPAATGRFSWTPEGLHAIVLSSSGTYFIEPLPGGNKNEYHSFTLAGMLANSPKFSCGVRAAEIAPQLSRQLAPNTVTGANLRIYRLAMASTGEYTQQWGGGTVAGGLAAITIVVNQVNAMYERDLAVRLVLINREDEVIFTNPVTDGYTSGNALAMLDENQARLDAILGDTAYDIGHVVDRNTANVGGIALVGDVCGLGKASGVSIMAAGPTHSFTPVLISHEMGHQFGGLHTFNGTTAVCGPNRTAISAYEPGSGSTILGYSFANCGDEGLPITFLSLYFHAFSIQQMNNYITATGPNSGSCAVSQGTGNSLPIVSGGNDFNIPARTPFKLTAEGFDGNGEVLTYTWEQLDLGAPAPPNTDDGFRPIFRSFDPATNPARSFPRLADVLSGNTTLGESLPTTTRALNFRVTVRDSHLPGGTNSDDTRLQVRGDAGPFRVTSPTINGNWTGGTTQEVTWDVAGTNAAPISASQVRLMLSVDGGQNFPYVLADTTANDGSQAVMLPNVSSATARVKVEAMGNVFYNISPNFTLTAGNQTTVQAFLNNGTETTEGANNGFTMTVARNGNTTSALTLDYATSDGTAQQRSDYVTVTGSLNFAAGETIKTITVPIVDDAYDETAETFILTLSNVQGAIHAGSGAVTITIADNDMGAPSGPNSLENREFFVRQQYYDFLNRIPDTAGFNYWTNELNQCGADAGCLRLRRIGVSAAFFVELEFQATGSVVYRMYRAAFGTMAAPNQTRANVTYSQFTNDRAQLIGGSMLEQTTVEFANRFVQRPAFLARYPANLTNAQFVNALFDTANLVPFAAERQAEIDAMNTQGRTRAQVLLNLANNNVLQQREYNPSFVLMQYFGYLRRDPDQDGYNFWLNVLNTPPNGVPGMVCAFLTSAEYQDRFSPVISRTNNECGGL